MIKFSLNQIKFLSTSSVLLLSWQSMAIANPDFNKKLKLKELPSLIAQMFSDEDKDQDVLVPNPIIEIDGKPVEQNTAPPPFLPRAVAPPVGDMSVSNINTDIAPRIDLGPNGLTIVPRLVLRDAPANEVLSLLARAADFNIVFVDQNEEEGDQGGMTSISLDLANQPVQEVFNNVLILAGLQASQRGNTIIIGKQLPSTARNLITRTIRLNQASPEGAANFLATQGAEVAIIFTPIEREFNQETGAVIRELQGVTELRPVKVPQSAEARSALPLTGLQVSTDDRTGSINLVGEPHLVQMATSFLTQLDVRRRQVAINVKVVDVNLGQNDSFGSSFSFNIDDTGVVQDGGAGVINFGTKDRNTRFPWRVDETGQSLIPPFDLDGELQGAPLATPRTGEISPFGSDYDPANPQNPAGVIPGQNFNVPSAFLVQIRASIQRGDARILTDPTLVVQEGQVGAVKLVENVVTSVNTEVDTQGVTAVRTITPVIEPAGLTVNVEIEKIDDNGFVSLRVNPTVSFPGDAITFDSGQGAINVITPLRERTVSSGLVRLRDGQTLILSGIIQEEELTRVQKVPILGDLPLLGSLFRSTFNERDRSEVLVVLSPQILDDSDSYSGFGYNYTPSRETGNYLRERGLNLPTKPY